MIDSIGSEINNVAWTSEFYWLNKKYTKLVKIRAKYANETLKNLL